LCRCNRRGPSDAEGDDVNDYDVVIVKNGCRRLVSVYAVDEYDAERRIMVASMFFGFKVVSVKLHPAAPDHVSR